MTGGSGGSSGAVVSGILKILQSLGDGAVKAGAAKPKAGLGRGNCGVCPKTGLPLTGTKR